MGKWELGVIAKGETCLQPSQVTDVRRSETTAQSLFEGRLQWTLSYRIKPLTLRPIRAYTD